MDLLFRVGIRCEPIADFTTVVCTRMADDDGDVMRTSMADATVQAHVAKEGGAEEGERTKRKHAYVDDVAEEDDDEEEDEDDDEEEDDEEEEEEEEVRRVAGVRAMQRTRFTSRRSMRSCFVWSFASWWRRRVCGEARFHDVRRRVWCSRARRDDGVKRVSDVDMARVRRGRRRDELVAVDRKVRGTSGAVSSTTSPTSATTKTKTKRKDGKNKAS